MNLSEQTPRDQTPNAVPDWKFDNNRPIYLQLVEQLELRILSGVYRPGDRLLSVRELAAECRVNPNTLQRALSELENKGLITNMRTLGRSITADTDLIASLRGGAAGDLLRDFSERMAALGYTDDEVIRMLTKERKTTNG